MEQKISALTTVDSMGTVTHFLGICFQWREEKDQLKVHLSQQAFAEQLIESAGLWNDSIASTPTPYSCGHPINAIPDKDIPQEKRKEI